MTDPDSAAALDAADPLAPLRARFRLPDGVVYLNGNSLGPLTEAVAARLRHTVETQWGEGLVGAWNTAGWYELPRRVGARLAPLLGVSADEAIVADSTSINVYKLLHAARLRHPDRRVLLLERDAFPTDNYIAEGLAAQHPAVQLRYVAREQLADALTADVAAALVGHVHYRDGHRLDIAALQRVAAVHDIPLVWDLAHSTGAVPLALADWGAEFAVGCGYKFLNGGPGAPAFAYVARAAQARLETPLTGWFGHARPFAFTGGFEPAPGIARLQVGTPPILSLSALDAALDAFDGVDMAALWAKSVALFERFIAQATARPALAGLLCVTPRQAAARGSQISFAHPQAQAICRALGRRGVVADYREPGLLRFGLAPLYLRFADIDHAVAVLADILENALWRDELDRPAHGVVT